MIIINDLLEIGKTLFNIITSNWITTTAVSLLIIGAIVKKKRNA